jgi:hypothetical protein
MLFIKMPHIADILTNLTEDPEKESLSPVTISRLGIITKEGFV